MNNILPLEALKQTAIKHKDYVNNTCFNAIQGAASGEIVALDDVTALPHQFKIQINSKNLFDTVGAKKYNGGGTLEILNNSIVISQTRGMWVHASVELSQELVGKTITFSTDCFTSDINEGRVVLMWYASSTGAYGSGRGLATARYSGATASKLSFTGVVPNKFNNDEDTLLLLFYSNYEGEVENGVACSATYSSIQIEYGETITPYTPCINGHAVTPIGKNLFNGILKEAPNIGPAYKRIEAYLPAGVYTISFSNQVYWQSSNTGYNGTTRATAFTFTATTSGEYWIQVRMAESNTTPWDDSTTIQIERGPGASEYEPPLWDSPNLMVTVVGKNLYNIPNIDSSLMASNALATVACNIPDTITISGQKDGVVVKNDSGTETSVWRFRINFASGKESFIMDAAEPFQGTFKGTPEDPIIQITYRNIYIRGGQYKDIQVEFGNVATKYEPYTIHNNISVPLDTGAQLASIAPDVTFMTQAPGAILEINYNKDTNKIIEKLTQAIVSLGGNI